MAIVSVPDVRGGQWCFNGTRLPVYTAKVCALSAGRDWTLENYPTLTNEMIDEAIAWPFPTIQEASPLIEDMTVDCACGEEAGIETARSSESKIGVGEHTYLCKACNRRWRITVTLDPA